MGSIVNLLRVVHKDKAIIAKATNKDAPVEQIKGQEPTKLSKVFWIASDV